jgi:hypothetical protein
MDTRFANTVIWRWIADLALRNFSNSLKLSQTQKTPNVASLMLMIEVYPVAFAQPVTSRKQDAFS